MVRDPSGGQRRTGRTDGKYARHADHDEMKTSIDLSYLASQGRCRYSEAIQHEKRYGLTVIEVLQLPGGPKSAVSTALWSDCGHDIASMTHADLGAAMTEAFDATQGSICRRWIIQKPMAGTINHCINSAGPPERIGSELQHLPREIKHGRGTHIKPKCPKPVVPEVRDHTPLQS